MLYDRKQVKMQKNIGPERLCFDLQPFKIDTCCKFLGPHRTWENINISTLDVAVFRTQVGQVKGRHFFIGITIGFLNYAMKVIPT
jgi:hypothetical protein